MEFTQLKGFGQVHKKWAMEFLEKVTAYPNEAIHDDCVVAFTGGYKKIATDNQPKRVNVDKWYSA